VDLLCSESDWLFRKRPDRLVLTGEGLWRLVFDLAMLKAVDRVPAV
jgi:hypothetical protein